MWCFGEPRFASTLVLLGGFCTGCRGAPSAEPTAIEVPVPPIASSAPLKVARPRLSPLRMQVSGTTAIDGHAPKEHFRGATDRASGELVVNLHDLSATRGTVKIDLTSLRTFTFQDRDKDAAQTKQAKTWLEAVTGDQVDESMRWAELEVRSIVDVAPFNDALNVTATRDARGATRTVSLRAQGVFVLHGHKAEKTVKLEAVLLWKNKDEGPPDAIHVRTPASEPMHVTLEDHQIRPRDELGKIAKNAFHLLGTKVAEVHDVAIDLTLTP
jgi:hypothetical protein